MKKNFATTLLLTSLFFCGFSLAQDSSIKLKSKIELRNWIMTSKALKSESFLSGATIKLYKENSIISETKSDNEGNFELDLPLTGNYFLLIEYAGREPKKFAVNTKAASQNKDEANFKPSVDIVGILMSKPKKGMEYIGLNQPSVSLTHNKNIGTQLRTNIYDGEYKLIQKFCTANKLGDMALEKKNYQLAKTFYLMASDMIEGEEYPKTQLKKAEEGIKSEKASRKTRKSKHSKVKSAITTKSTTTKANNTSGNKSSVETGKAARKTRVTLGGSK